MVNYYIDLSERILTKAKLQEDNASLRKELYYIRTNGLKSKINTDELKKIFWINIYNSYVLIMADENLPSKNPFKLKRIKFSNFRLSLNDIEYGILGIQKYNLGFCKIYNPFYPYLIKKLAIEKKDNTIFTRLNKNILSKTTDLKK
jgi:hypothetical protein